MIRTEITVLPADPPGKILIGWGSWICPSGGNWLYKGSMPRSLVRHIRKCDYCRQGFLESCPTGCLGVWGERKLKN
jgi:hypothetical protein